MRERIRLYGKSIIITLIMGSCILLLLSGLVIAWENGNQELADNEAAVWFEVTEAPPYLTVLSTDPEDNELHVGVESEIKVTFDRDITPGSEFDFIAVEDETNTAAGIIKAVAGNLLTITPEKLAYGTTYTVTIPVNSVTALNDSGITLETDYTFTFTTGFQYGDVTGSGEVDVGDAIIILRHTVNLVDIEAEYGPEALIRADVDGNGQVDVGDAILVLRYIVGIITEFPVESQ